MEARIIKAHIFPEPKAGETDNINRGMDNFRYHTKIDCNNRFTVQF